jgi:hypothetical protein
MYTTATIKYNNADIVVVTLLIRSQLKFKVFIVRAVICTQKSGTDVFDPEWSSPANVVTI